jgi:hypothetical protein
MEEKSIGVNSSTTSQVVEPKVVSSPKVETPVVKQTAQPVNPTAEQPKTNLPEKLLSQDEVNKIVAGRLREANKKIHTKFGVDSEAALEALVGKGQTHDALQGQIKALTEEISNMKFDKVMRLSKIRADKFEDVKAILKSKNLPFEENAVKEILKTHPEWVRKPLEKVVRPIGNNGAQPTPPNEKDMVRSLFKSLRK